MTRIALRGLTGALLLAAVAWLIGPARVAAQLRAVEPAWFAAAVAVAIVAQFASALRWAAIARVLGLAAPTALFLASYARGIVLNVLVPGATVGGDALRSVSLQRHGNPLDVAVLSVLLDRASGLWVLCAMSALACAGFALGGRVPADMQPLLAPYAIGLGAALLLPFVPWRAGQPGRSAGAADASARNASADDPLLRKLTRKFAALHALLLARRRALLRSLWGSALVQLFSAGALWLCLRSAGGEAGFAAVLAVAAPVFVAAALPVSIGGFGTREAAAALAFPLAGIPASLGVTAAALYGLTAVGMAVLAAPLFAVRSAVPQPLHASSQASSQAPDPASDQAPPERGP